MVARALHDDDVPRPIVVGVDGSDPSRTALDWAARYARQARVPLTVVVAWRRPTDYGWTLPLPDDWDPEAEARAMLDREVAEVLGADPGVELTASVIEGPPARVLTEASQDASLVVVASRGRGEFAGMLLGSVGEHLTAHAHCPVVVVRGGTERTPGV